MGIRYEQWPARPQGGQRVGSGPCGVRGVHYANDGTREYPTGVEAACELHRSQFKNRLAVQEMIAWALSSAGIKEPTHD